MELGLKDLVGSMAWQRLITSVRDNIRAHMGMSNKALEELC